MTPAGTYPDPEQPERTIHVYAMHDGGPHAELHLRIDPTMPPARPGAGGVHHIALRVQDDQYHDWNTHLTALGLRTSGEVDRHWFHSIYYREPQGILIELATDGPGFTVDEHPDHLGETLILAPFLEPRRAQIEAGLTPSPEPTTLNPQRSRPHRQLVGAASRAVRVTGSPPQGTPAPTP
ncbi:VOC family protein [Deinococcus aquaticus]|uniref:VOC family protein n=1 Tax=Deinococcus aquaticus TaxID=328692 RepID=UPI003610B685